MKLIDRGRLCRIKAQLLLMPVFLASCSTKSMDPGDYIKSLWWDVKMNHQEAGEQLIADPAYIWRKLRCDSRQLPYLQVDDHEVIPLRLTAGEKINHHMIYSLCPATASEVVPARLSRSILYKGDVIFQDVTENYELKPGRWSVDAFVKVAEQAHPGVYSLQLTLTSEDLNISVNTGFVVFRDDEGEPE